MSKLSFQVKAAIKTLLLGTSKTLAWKYRGYALPPLMFYFNIALKKSCLSHKLFVTLSSVAVSRQREDLE